jgi:hypothetical protein
VAVHAVQVRVLVLQHETAIFNTAMSVERGMAQLIGRRSRETAA